MARIALTSLLEPQVEHRPHMQAADRGVRIPGAAGAVLLEDVGEPRGVVGQMLERHRAVLDERDRFALLLHRHHDVEAGGAHLGDRGLQPGIEHLDHAAPCRAGLVPAEAEIAHQLARAASGGAGSRPGPPRRTRRAGSPPGSPRTNASIVGRNIAMSRASPSMVRSTSSTAIGPSLTMCCAASIALWKLPKWQAPTARRPEQRRELQLDLGGERERALGADQNVREIEIVAAGHQRVEIVAADPALHFGKARLDLVGLARRQREQVARERHERRLSRQVGEIARGRTEMRARPVRQHRIDREHVLAGVAVAQRARAAGIVADHAADGGARGGRDVDRKPQPVRLAAGG